MMTPYSLALYGATGSGKTTQIGEEAKRLFSQTGKKTLLHAIDPGGFDSIEHLVGSCLEVEEIGDENPWVWIQDKILNPPSPDDFAGLAFDSATGIGDLLLNDAAALAAQGVKVGSEGAYSLQIPNTSLRIGANNKSQYGLIQTFLLDQIGRASRLTKRGFNVLWTFGEQHPEGGESPTIGPKLVGKALTLQLPRFIRYTLRMVTIAEMGGSAVHRLLTQPQLESDGLTSCLVNSRFPLQNEVECPPFIEPASLEEFWTLIERAKEAARI